MLSKLQKMRKDKKGFTLVELIVVLVILGILIAMLVPALTGYIDRAHDRQDQAECKLVLTAAQSVAGEEYAEDPSIDSVDVDEVQDLAEVEGTVASVTVENGKVTGIEYTAASGNSYTYTGSAWE